MQDTESLLDEGPTHDVVAYEQLDIISPEAMIDRWPHYGPAATALGVRSLSAIALTNNTDNIGSLVAFDPRDPPSPASRARMRDIGAALTAAVLERADPGIRPAPPVPVLAQADYHDLTHQATGMIAAQTGCTVADALALLKARAFAEGVTIETLASQVLSRATRFQQ